MSILELLLAPFFSITSFFKSNRDNLMHIDTLTTSISSDLNEDNVNKEHLKSAIHDIRIIAHEIRSTDTEIEEALETAKTNAAAAIAEEIEKKEMLIRDLRQKNEVSVSIAQELENTKMKLNAREQELGILKLEKFSFETSERNLRTADKKIVEFQENYKDLKTKMEVSFNIHASEIRAKK